MNGFERPVVLELDLSGHFEESSLTGQIQGVFPSFGIGFAAGVVAGRGQYAPFGECAILLTVLSGLNVSAVFGLLLPVGRGTLGAEGLD